MPTLVLDDGRSLAESGAILWYFGEGTRFVPEDRTSGRRCCSGCSSSSTTTSPRSRSSRFWLAYSGRPEAFADRLEERMAAGYRALDAMERHLDGREFLVGDAPTLADIALYAYTHVADEGGFDLGAYPAIGAWLDRVAGAARSRPDRRLSRRKRASRRWRPGANRHNHVTRSDPVTISGADSGTRPGAGPSRSGSEAAAHRRGLSS